MTIGNPSLHRLQKPGSEPTKGIRALEGLLPSNPAVLPTCRDRYPPSECHRDIQSYIEQVKAEWEATADALPHLVCLLNEEGRIVRANRTIERWGLGNVADIKGRNLHHLLHPNCSSPDCYLNRLWEQTVSALAKGEPTGCQVLDPVLERYLDFQIHSYPASSTDEFNPGQRFAVAVVSDISELKAGEKALESLTHDLMGEIEKRTSQLQLSYTSLQREIDMRIQIEAALKASREEYKQLVETMHDGLAVVDLDGVIIYANASAGRILGCSREDLIGRTASDFVDPSCRETWDRQMSLRNAGQDDNSYDLLLKARDGRRAWIHVSPSVIRDHMGRQTGSFAVLTDFTYRVQTERALKSSAHELRLLSTQVLTMQEKERQRIAAELHDGLGQTLSAIKFSLENTLASCGGSGDGHHCGAKQAEYEALIPRLQGAIEEVRRISMDLRPSMLDDLGILATLRWFCREFQADYASIKIDLNADIQEDEVIKPLKLIIFRIVQEALNNVAKHAGSDQVSIRLCLHRQKIELEIEDQGIGFDPGEIAEKRSRRKGGSGLLSMRERAEYSGGRFTISSKKGSGTKIHIVWPKKTPG